jgi:hypothetical protein
MVGPVGGAGRQQPDAASPRDEPGDSDLSLSLETTSCHTRGITGEANSQVEHVADIPNWSALTAWLGADR